MSKRYDTPEGWPFKETPAEWAEIIRKRSAARVALELDGDDVRALLDALQGHAMATGWQAPRAARLVEELRCLVAVGR